MRRVDDSEYIFIFVMGILAGAVLATCMMHG
jgi:hypothetical protein